jgi:starvation-inducible DNA-binding protein
MKISVHGAFMHNHPVAEALKQALADSQSLALKTQNFHWNVTGPQFPGLHQLFETQYTDLQAAIDLVAERIRALGVRTPGGLGVYSRLSHIADGDENATAEQMVRTLRDDQLVIVGTLKTVLELAQKHSDDVSSDLMVERLQQHQKNAWMLSSILGEESPHA